jgi:hypothetical protein
MAIQIKRNQVIAFGVSLLAALAVARIFVLNDGEKTATGQTTPVVGEVLSVEGSATLRPPRQSGAVELPLSLGPLNAEALVQSRAASAVVIEFRPGPTLRLLENTRLIAEVEPSRPDSIQATILSGEVAVLNPGTNSAFVLLKDGMALDYSQGQIPRTVPLIQVGDGLPDPGLGAEEELRIEKESELSSPPVTDIEPDVREKEKIDRPGKDDGSETQLFSTLTNDDIRSQVKAQAGGFQKCFVGMVNRKSEAGQAMTALPKGEIKVSFKIKPAGNVTESKVVSSPFNDKTFDLCVTEALERITFNSFQGATIPVSEFPILLE